jgi:hypothetical protein
MKQTLTLITMAMIAINVVSCKKDDAAEPAATGSTTSNNTPTDMEYYVQYTDGGKTYKRSTEISYSPQENFVQNRELAAFIGKTGVFNEEHGWVKIIFPVDSSSISKVVLNKKYITRKVEPTLDENTFMYSTPDEYIGALYYEMEFNDGKDILEDQEVTTQYYHIIKSIKYLKNAYDKATQKNKAYFVVTGEFNISVKNNSTNLTRDLTNGSYKVVLGVLPK